MAGIVASKVRKNRNNKEQEKENQERKKHKYLFLKNYPSIPHPFSTIEKKHLLLLKIQNRKKNLKHLKTG